MSAVAEYFRKIHGREMAEFVFQRELGEAIFTQWRDYYVARLCGYIRVYNDAERAGLTLPPPFRSKHWCNAAVHLLTAADIEIQDYFLRAEPKEKDRLVQAVIDDDGIWNLAGQFVELPTV